MPQSEFEVASLNDIDPRGSQQVEADGTQILLVRTDDAVHAIGAICPHAGGPLAEGVRHGDRLICPWHKATFCVRTGNVLEPPALDALPRYKVRIDGGRVFVTVPSEEAPRQTSTSDGRCFVIVGAGAAGAVAAQTLREIGFSGRVVMLDRENRVPYDRTVLSKHYLSGEHGSEKSPLQTQDFYRRHAIERVTAEVIGIDVHQRSVNCADGSSFNYDSILLATGGEPRRPGFRGSALGNVFVLRSRSDAEAILAQAERSQRVVVLGASFIGMEVAASLRERGLDVTVVGAENAPFEKHLGVRIGSAFLSLHRQHGVSFRLGCEVTSLKGGPDVSGVVLKNGDTIPADLVVIGFGAAPATAWIDDLPIQKDGSVLVDDFLRAADGVYVAGDIARFPNRGNGEPIRVEHWRVAQQHGRIAAHNMAGHQVPYDAVPMFWTIQYMKQLDYIGHASSWDDIVVHGDLEKPQFLAYYMKDGAVIAATGFDRDRDTAALVELFTIQKKWTAEALGDNPAAVLADRVAAQG
jgi:NADPH-dependent 2,4-dienoyl-CoA reductase/sulfur reductase-like enzyme/nitrite reductase/ring-hydroxylating ferredoxin subunit